MKCVRFRLDRQLLLLRLIGSFRVSYGHVPIAYSRRMKVPSVTSSDHLAPHSPEAAKDKPATTPAVHAAVKRAGATPGAAAAELRDQIETWVEEGGAGDDVVP
jgi:hypothetical protein